MPLPETLLGKGPCGLSEKWALSLVTSQLIVLLASVVNTDPRIRMIARGISPLTLISGWRSEAAQLRLAREGRPAAIPALSTHLSCPSTGADLRLCGFMDPFNSARDNAVWAYVGEAAEKIGLRWGGGSPRSSGLPSDFNHFDLGPRSGQQQDVLVTPNEAERIESFQRCIKNASMRGLCFSLR